MYGDAAVPPSLLRRLTGILLTCRPSQGGRSSRALVPSDHLAPRRQTRSFAAGHLYGAAIGTGDSDPAGAFSAAQPHLLSLLGYVELWYRHGGGVMQITAFRIGSDAAADALAMASSSSRYGCHLVLGFDNLVVCCPVFIRGTF